MVRINKVTTKTGDKGNTTLAGGQKVSKSSLRIEAYGSVDELNSYLGVVAEMLRDVNSLNEIRKKILCVQNELFNLGSQLSVLQEDRRENTPVIQEENIKKLEEEIKKINSNLPSLKLFVLPGGNIISANLHVARTVCRRVERNIVRLNEVETLDGTELPYINRLSDWLFVVSRYVCKILGKEEILWKPKQH